MLFSTNDEIGGDREEEGNRDGRGRADDEGHAEDGKEVRPGDRIPSPSVWACGDKLFGRHHGIQSATSPGKEGETPDEPYNAGKEQRRADEPNREGK